MAEVMLKEMLREMGGVKILSAGTFAIEGQGASENAVRAMDERGIDIKAHKSKAVVLSMIDEADLILTMTRNHKEILLKVAPDQGEKIYTLKEYTNSLGADVLDPFGQPIDVYRNCADEIEECLKIVAEKIKKSKK